MRSVASRYKRRILAPGKNYAFDGHVLSCLRVTRRRGMFPDSPPKGRHDNASDAMPYL